MDTAIASSAGDRHLWVHDSSGHPLQVQLSRSLAKRGYHVTHSHLSEFQSPKGPLDRLPDDPDTFRLIAIERGRPFPKYAAVHRLIAERRYADLLIAELRAQRPQVLLSSNMSIAMAHRVSAACERLGIAYIHWLQDVYFRAVSAALSQRSKALAAVVSGGIARVERRVWRRSRHVVAIADDFVGELAFAGLPQSRVTVIPNWAPLKDWPQLPRENAWRAKQGLGDQFVFLYSGTLGYKHDPGRLLALARRFPDVAVVVVSEGLGADWLAAQKASHPVPNLHLIPFQPYDEVPAMMAAADVLVVLLEASAGAYSVPSKTLSYHCAGRPLLLSAPSKNLAARIVIGCGSGIVCEAGNESEFLNGASKLLDDAGLRDRFGSNARAYAEQNFDIDAITDRFERLITGVANGGTHRERA